MTKRHIEYEADDDIENTNLDSNNIMEFQNNKINVFYNFDDTHITIKSTHIIQSIRLYSITGQCLMQTRQVDIDTSNLPAGVYIITANAINGETLQTKFINY